MGRPMRHGLYMGRPENYVGRPVYLTGRSMGRPMCCPVLKGACACADVIFLRYVVVGFSLVFPRLDSVGQLLSAHETHIASTHYSHISAPPTIRSDGFMWVTTSSSCSTPAAAAAQQEHVPLQHPVLLQNTLLHYPLYSKYNASTSSDIWRRLPTLTGAAAVLIPGSTSTHEGERRCNFRSEDVPCLGLLHEVAPAVPSAGRTITAPRL